MKTQDKILRGKWYAFNIKARREQTEEHYISLMRKMLESDPLVELNKNNKYASLKELDFSKNESGNIEWVKIVMMTYTIIDPNAFYDKRDKKDVSLEFWNSDLVANKQELPMVFFPEIHTMAVKKNPKVSINTALRYMTSVVGEIEPEMFDVTINKDNDTIQYIKNAHTIVKIEANLSFSNPGLSGDFAKAFDQKIYDMNPKKMNIVAEGTEEHPLCKEEDGFLDTVLQLSEQNGEVKAKIKETETSSYRSINTSHYPAVFDIKGRAIHYYYLLKDKLVAHYGRR